MNKSKKRRKNRKFKLINGCRGTIALFLAVLMTPFLTIAMLLVEVGRYNSAVSILDEALGTSSISLLASYDKYLKDRWGLLALDQGLDLEAEFTNYLSSNASVLGNSIDLDSISVEGDYSLDSSEVLFNQILEYCSLNAPTTLAMELLNLSDLLSKLEDIADMGKYFSIIGSGATAVDSAITLAESADTIKTKANELDGLKTDYSEDYKAFKTAVENLASALKEDRPEDEGEAKKYDKNIKNLQDKVDTAQTNYKETLEDISTKLGEYKEAMSACLSSISTMGSEVLSMTSTIIELANDREKKQDELNEIDKTIAEMEKNGENVSTPALYTQALDQREDIQSKLAEIALEESMLSAAQSGLSTTADGWEESFGNYSDALMGELAKSFGDLAAKVEKFDSSAVTDTTEITDSEYFNLSLAGYVSAEDIDAYLAEQASEMATSSLSSLLDGIISFFNSLLKLQLFYDPALSAYINVDFYSTNFGGLPGADSAEGGVLPIISSIGSMISSVSEFSVKLLTLQWLDALKAVKNFFTSIADLGTSIVQFGIDIAVNIKDLFSSLDRLYYSTYTTYNLPCRTDFTSGKPGFTAMTGYSLTKQSLAESAPSSTLTVVDDLMVLVDQLRSAMNGSGDDYTFCGAELEYVLFGSNSELSNQMYAFVAIYLLRLLIDIPSILANPEVQSLAASSTLAYPVVMILEILVEPLMDTILLVNGGKAGLYKTQIYLTPTGFPKYLGNLTPLLTQMSQEEKDNLGSDVLSAFEVSEDDYKYKQMQDKLAGTNHKPGKVPEILQFSYREHCLIVLLLTVRKEQQMARLGNLIQMETYTYYKNDNVPYSFDLSKANTFVNVNVDARLNQMLPSLADSSLFKVKREQYRGY